MKKSKMIRKRLASMILSFVMLFGEFYSGGMTVFAGDGDVRISEDDPAITDPGDDVTEDEEVLYEGSSEETAEETDEDMPAQEPASDEDVIVDDFDTDVEDAMIDHPVEEEDIDHAAATWVNVVTRGSHVTLRSGDSNGNASFSNGILTLKNYQVYDNSGGYTPIYQGGEVTGNPYYGIYADGDLIIEVEGENVFDLGLSSETSEQYGIYAKGSLTIRNVSGKDGSLKIDLNGKGGSGNAPTTCGAYAALGDLTIEEQKGGSLDVDVYGNVAKSNTVAYMEALGIRSEGYKVYIKGGDISIYTVAGNRNTKGISGLYYFQTGGNVTVKPAQTTGNSTNQTIGVFAAYGVEVTGGSLDCTANNATAATGGISYGVYCQSDIKFLSETQITAGSTDGGRSVGVFSEANNGVFSLLCKSTIKAGDYAILASKIDNIGYCYLKPSPATVKTALSENGRTFFSVFDKSGNVAKEVQTDKEEGYPVWVGGIRLTDSNKNAIPSVDSGSASYDPQTKTLTLKGVKNISGAFNPVAGDQALIYANDDLIIELESDSELPMVIDDTVTNQYGIAAKGNLTIRNVSGKNASLDLDMYCDGSGSGKVSNGYAIYCSGNLTIEENNGGSLSLDITDNLTTYLAYCIRSDGTVSVTGGDIDITTLPAGTARGVSAVTYEQSGGDVLIEALKKSGIRNYNNISSLEAADISVTGGKLTAYAGKGVNSSHGISCTKSFVLGKNGEVDCAGGGANYEANDNGLFGDFDCDGNNKIVIGGKFHAAAKSYAVNTRTMSAGDSVLNVKSAISLANSVMLLKPEGGNVDGGGNDAARRFIADSSGKPAAEVVTGFTSMHEVKFNLNGKGSSTPATQYIEDGKYASEPTAPVADGYDFGGWYTDSSCSNKFSFSTAIKKDYTLYAKWTIKQYTVTFNVNGHGTAPSAVKVDHGAKVSKPTDPTASGYTFGGWYKEASCTNAYNFNTAVTANITLYAKWTENAKVYYTVTFNANGHGTAPSAQRVESGSTATQPTAPTATGYTFGGWYKEASCTNQYSFSTKVTANITLYAKWTINQYTVTFNANGHGTAPSAVKVNYGAKVSKPTDPTASGYTFGGWYKESSCTNLYDFSTAVTSSFTLYAKWTENAKVYYTVTFNANGHGTAPAAQQVESGKYATQPTAPTATGYTFGGWYKEASCTNQYSFSTKVTANITLYAKWTINQYTVTFNANGHGTAPSAVKVNYGAKVSKPTDPTASGYTFGGWYKESSCTNLYDFNTAVTSSFTLYAKWTENAKVYYTVTFNANGHGTAPAAQQVESGKYATQPTAPTETGYTFGGWYKEAACTNAYSFSTKVTANITLYAKWTINQYTVTFNANGHGTAPSAVKVNYGAKVSKPSDPAVTGYIFGGWYKESGCTNAYDFSAAVTANITLYAKWTLAQYTVTFNANGHGTAPSAVKVNYGAKVSKPTDPTATGYTFGGWYKEAGCTNQYNFNSTVTSDITLYAKWTINQYTVTFSANGHGTAPSAVKVNYGAKVSKPTDPTADGYTFGGWYTESSCVNAYDFSSAVTKNITLYARWTVIQYTVTFNANGHGTAPSAVKVNWGAKVSKPTDPAADGYIFGGWYKEAACTNSYDFNSAVKSSFTLYAKWTQKEPEKVYYTVTFDMNGHGSAITAQTVESGKTVTKPTNPTEDGYTFGGWYTESSCVNAYDFSSAVTKDITLYAKWTVIQFTVTFNANGHGTAPSAVTVNWGEKISKPADLKADGYTFGGWYTDSKCTSAYNFNNLVKSSFTLYAKWTQIRYVVTFNANGHGSAPASVSVNWGEKVTKPEDPKADGYTFGGWYTESSCKNAYDFNTAVKSNITLYAKWTQIELIVTFYINSDDSAPSAVMVKWGTKVSRPDDPKKDGYKFAGWYTDRDYKKEYDFDTLVKEDLSLYAKWTEILTVTFDNNGHGKKPDAQKVVKGEKATEPSALSEKGYIFGGWYTEKECSRRFDFDTAITANITLYAKWDEKKADIEYFTVSFSLNGKSGNVPPQQTIEKGKTAVAPAAPSAEGYSFEGWYTDKNGTEKYDFSTAVTKDITLYAKWNELILTVTFDANGHGIAPANQEIKYGAKAVKPADPSADGYVFGGWFKEAACTALYDFSSPVKADITLYAFWSEESEEPEPGPEPGPDPIEGGLSPLDPYPSLDASTTDLYLVKGQHFNIGAGWVVNKADKKYLSISKKGALKTKKTGEAQISYGDHIVTVHISKPSVTKSLKLTFAEAGETPGAQIEIVNEDGLDVLWYSAAPDVATVDQNGYVTAVAQGKAKITAYINGSAYNCTVSVKEKVAADNRSIHIDAGTSKKLSLKGMKGAFWSSSSDSVAMVINGKILARSTGTAVLTADNGIKVNVIVEKSGITGLDGGKNKYKLSMDEGEDYDLEFESLERTVVFKSSKPDIAFIDEFGHIVARKAGKAKFTTKINGKTITVSVKVDPADE